MGRIVIASLTGDPVPRAAGHQPRTSGDAEYAYLEPLLVRYAEIRSSGDDCPATRARLVSGYLPVAQHIALRYRDRGEPLDDLEQVATIGLLKAIERFHPGHGVPFLAYAVPTMTGEIKRHFRDRTWSMCVPRRLKELHLAINAAVVDLSLVLNRPPRPSDIAARLGISLDEVLEGLEAGESYQTGSLDQPLGSGEKGSAVVDVVGVDGRGLDRFIASGALAPDIAGLPDRDREILVMRFYDDMTRSQIAAKLGISQMHVSRLLSKILAYLRNVVDDDLPPRSGPDHPLTLQRTQRQRSSPRRSCPEYTDEVPASDDVHRGHLSDATKRRN